MTINNVGYELKASTTSGAQIELASDPDGISHTNNGVDHQNLLSIRMIGIRHEKVSVLPPPKESRTEAKNQPALSISTGIVLAPQMPKLPAVQEMVTTQGQIELHAKLSGLAPTEIPHFTVELVELLPQIPVKLVEPGLAELIPQLPVELLEQVLPHPVELV